MVSSSEADQDDLSTSSDEDIHIGKKDRKKRERKNYRPEGMLRFRQAVWKRSQGQELPTKFKITLPADDEELFDLEESEEFSCASDESSEAPRPKTHKRRKSTSLTAGDGAAEPSEDYDEDEVALQQAIAMSMAGIHL